MTSAPSQSDSPLIAFYGDDFTGSTDVMEVLEMAGCSTTLFLDPPTPAQLAAVPPSRGLGLAGISRSLPTAEMEAELRPKFEFLKSLGAKLVHYKVCSTMDSSPEVGSIGRAIDIGFEVFEPKWSPIVLGAPRLNRFVAFGNLFARVGETTHRLDRHPTMSRHPITPMAEADIGRHLSAQTDRRMVGVDTLALQAMMAGESAGLSAEVVAYDLVVFDTIRDDELAKIGEIVWRAAGGDVTFSASSSGLEYALAEHWRRNAPEASVTEFPSAGMADKTLVMSGSAAPATAAQIQHARKAGWAMIRLDAERLLDPAQREAEFARIEAEVLAEFATASGVGLFTTEGPDDPAIIRTRERAEALGVSSVGAALGRAQGQLLRQLLKVTGIRRVCVAGGDTSGYCARELGIYALRLIAPIDPGSPLCRAHADGAFDGLEISLKGGQVGRPDYFECIQQGDTHARSKLKEIL